MTALAVRDTGFLPLPTDGFRVPRRWRAGHSLLVPAGPAWVELDFAAVVASRSKLKHLFGPSDPWPPEDLDRETDRADLEWHQAEFLARRSFAYHLLNHDADQCLGCLYIYPTASRDHDAEAYLWTHIDLDRARAARIETEVIDWVTHQWPLAAVAWPGRFIPFADWEDAALPNYYACYRTVRAPPEQGTDTTTDPST